MFIIYIIIFLVWALSFIGLLYLYYPLYIKFKREIINEKAGFFHFVFGMMGNRDFIRLFRDQIPYYLRESKIIFFPIIITLFTSGILSTWYKLNTNIIGLISFVPEIMLLLVLGAYYDNRPINDD